MLLKKKLSNKLVLKLKKDGEKIKATVRETDYVSKETLYREITIDMLTVKCKKIKIKFPMHMGANNYVKYLIADIQQNNNNAWKYLYSPQKLKPAKVNDKSWNISVYHNTASEILINLDISLATFGGYENDYIYIKYNNVVKTFVVSSYYFSHEIQVPNDVTINIYRSSESSYIIKDINASILAVK